MNIKEITLLSREEYFEYQHLIPVMNGWWWLRSSSSTFQVYYVLQKYVQSIAVNNTYGYIRPALVVEELNALPGEKVHLFDLTWTVLDKHLILCDSYIGHSHFDLKTNNWNTSRLKMELDNWFNEQLLAQEIFINIRNKTEWSFFQNLCKKYNISTDLEMTYEDFIDRSQRSNQIRYMPYKKSTFVFTTKQINSTQTMSFAEFCEYITENNYDS